jgi:hypothetical protein
MQWAITVELDKVLKSCAPSKGLVFRFYHLYSIKH